MSTLIQNILKQPNASHILKEHILEGYVFSSADQRQYKHAWQSQFVANDIRLKELHHLNEQLAGKDIKVTLLKGMTLIQDIYLDLGQRSMCDIDILASNHDIQILKELLLSNGYKELTQSKWWANDFKAIFEKNVNGLNVVIETHTKLFYNETDHFDWNISLVKVPGLTHFYQLSPNHQLVHLIGHLAFQHTFLFLHWLLDIELYLKKYEVLIDLDKCLEISKGLKMNNSFLATIYCLEQYCGMTLPLKKTEKLSRTLRSRLSLEFLIDPQKHKARYFQVKHLLKDDLSAAIRYDLGWLGEKLNAILGKS